MSASEDVDFVLRSTWNMAIENGRGGVERTDTVEHGILCALALSKKMKILLKQYISEEDQHKVLKGLLEDEPTECTGKSSGTIKPHLTSIRKREVWYTQKATGGGVGLQ